MCDIKQMPMDEAIKLQARLDAYTMTLPMAEAVIIQAVFDRTGQLPDGA